MGLVGILIALGLLIWLAYRGWSILLLAPAAAILAAAFAGEPLLAHWTQTFMASAAQFVMQFFPIFLLGALFGKLMEDCGSVTSIAKFMTERLGPQRAVLAVVLAGAIVTYGGVSLFVAFFVLAPMAHQLFRAAAIPRRLMPAAIALGTIDLHHVGAARHARDPERDPDAVLRHHALRRAGARHHRGGRHVRLRHVVARAGRAQRARQRRGLWGRRSAENAAEDLVVRERATTAQRRSIPPRCVHGRPSDDAPADRARGFAARHRHRGQSRSCRFSSCRAWMRLFSTKPEWGDDLAPAVGGVWAVVTALAVAIVVLIAINYRRLPALRDSMDAGANASVLPVLSVASLVGFGSVVAALPAFGLVRDWVLGIEGGPLVSLAVATNVLASLTGSASGGLDDRARRVGRTYLKIAA